jgi:hypothetical protein
MRKSNAGKALEIIVLLGQVIGLALQLIFVVAAVTIEHNLENRKKRGNQV